MMGEEALFNLRWDAQRSALLGSMASLYREEAFVDTTIVADNKIFKAHKLLLSASSSYLRSILESVPASQHAVICMPQVSSIDMGNLLRFIYEGQIKISRRSLRPFLATAKLLRIKGMDFELNEELDVALPPPHQHNHRQSIASPVQYQHNHGTKRGAPPSDSTTCNNNNNDDSNNSEQNQPPSKRGSPSNVGEEQGRASSPGAKDDEQNGDSKSKGSTGSIASGSPPHNNNNNDNGSSVNNNNLERPSSRSVGGGSVHSEMDMIGDQEDESNQSSMEPLQLISLSRIAQNAENDQSEALNLVDHHGGDSAHAHQMMLGDHDRDDMMSNGGVGDYDDEEDEDHAFSMSIQPEVSLRESDESYSVHSGGDRRSHHSSPHSSLEIKHVPNLLSTAFGGLPMTGGSGMMVTATGGSNALHNLQTLKNLHKLRPLIPKAHQSSSVAAAASFQNMSEGILMRMMRGEPAHLGHGGAANAGSGGGGNGASLSSKPGGSSSSSSLLSHHASSFFDLGHGETSHAGGAGLRKQKRYVQCTSCSKVLSSLSALKRHMEDVHCARIQGKCLLCGRVYSSRNSLLTHVYSAHKKHHDYKAVARIIRESDFEQFATAEETKPNVSFGICDKRNKAHIY